jgi:hypothetical protein
MPGLGREQSWWTERRDIYTLLRKFRKSEATDQRDMLFALLGISSDNNNALCANYQKSLDQVIIETASILLFDVNLEKFPITLPYKTLLELIENLGLIVIKILRKIIKEGDS